MSSRDQVRSELQAYLMKTEIPLCDACIERNNGWDFKTVNPINNEFKKKNFIERGHGVCPSCGKSKLVNIWNR